MNMNEKRTPLLLLMRLMFVWHLVRYEYEREENALIVIDAANVCMAFGKVCFLSYVSHIYNEIMKSFMFIYLYCILPTSQRCLLRRVYV